MPLPFVISGRWKDLSDLVKKKLRAIAADQRGAVRASATRGRGGYSGIASRFLQQLVLTWPPPTALGKHSHILGSVLRT